MTHRTLAAVVLAAMALPSAAMAQPVPPATPALLTISVEGRTTRTPDVAEISGGVVTTAPTASAALAENADKMNAVVAAVRKAGIAARDIQTAGLNLQAQYRYENNQAPILTGYQVSNTVNLRVRAVAQTGKLIDTLVGVGANQINGPTFRVEDSDAALDEARQAAIGTAKARAELYAKASGLRVRRIVTISEGGAIEPIPRPMMMKTMAMDAERAPTPVAAGEVAMSVIVTVVFALE